MVMKRNTDFWQTLLITTINKHRQNTDIDVHHNISSALCAIYLIYVRIGYMLGLFTKGRSISTCFCVLRVETDVSSTGMKGFLKQLTFVLKILLKWHFNVRKIWILKYIKECHKSTKWNVFLQVYLDSAPSSIVANCSLPPLPTLPVSL